MSEKRFEYAGSWENWTRIWSRELLSLLVILVKFKDIPDGPVYEFGCYPGVVTRKLRRLYHSKREVIGFDLLKCNIRNTVVCDVFDLPKQYDKPIAIALNELWHEDREAIFEQIYNKILPGGIYIQALKGPDYPVKNYLVNLERIQIGPEWIFVGRKKDV